MWICFVTVCIYVCACSCVYLWGMWACVCVNVCVFLYVCTHIHVSAHWCFWVISSPSNYSETCEIEKQVGTPYRVFPQTMRSQLLPFLSPFILLRFPTQYPELEFTDVPSGRSREMHIYSYLPEGSLISRVSTWHIKVKVLASLPFFSCWKYEEWQY